jgi:NADPH-dependent 2,4-dienoyl-CoA reductase/sulfur reductase-like enzyme
MRRLALSGTVFTETSRNGGLDGIVQVQRLSGCGKPESCVGAKLNIRDPNSVSDHGHVCTDQLNGDLKVEPFSLISFSLSMSAPLGPKLRIAIAGAGMSGLATALALAQQGFTHVHVYEVASDLGFVGAGIQVAPNLSRQLQRLGVWEHMAQDAVDLKEASIRGTTAPDSILEY